MSRVIDAVNWPLFLGLWWKQRRLFTFFLLYDVSTGNGDSEIDGEIG